jgi:nucleotide-binding universal stress UspA family protein
MFKHMLVPLDGSPLAERILPFACALAEKCGARLTLLHVIEKRAPAMVHTERHLTNPAEAEEYLRQAGSALPCGPGIEHHVHVDPVGDVGRSIVAHAQEIGADLIAITTHGAGGMKRALFGSIAQQVLSRCRQPVLLIPSRYEPGAQPVRLERFLVPVDLNPGHGPAIELALQTAQVCGAQVILMGIAATAGTLTGMSGAAAQVQPLTSAALLDAERERFHARLIEIQLAAARMNVPSHIVIDQGPPGARILLRMEQTSYDLVIFASHRRRGLDAVLTGSVGQQLCNGSKSPLLIVPV